MFLKLLLTVLSHAKDDFEDGLRERRIEEFKWGLPTPTTPAYQMKPKMS